MSEAATDPALRVLVGDCRETLRELDAESVQCCVTSPPYWGLRDYGHAGQLGLEATPEAYVAAMVGVFDEVHRVLRPDGTLWLNLGDSYATGAGAVGNCPGGGKQGERWARRPSKNGRNEEQGGYRGARNGKEGKHCYLGSANGVGPMTQPNRMPIAGLKPKDLVGIPWRVAFALQAAGWYLRSDIIWHKPNPMPESVMDRPTKAHEYLFLLTKAERYYYDAEAIKEKVSGTANPRKANGPNSRMERERTPLGLTNKLNPSSGSIRGGVTPKSAAAGSGIKANASFHEAGGLLVDFRNKRTVWTVASAPYKGAHFATYPAALITPCILAGSRPGEVVLDPFGGSGTTGAVALALGRRAVLCELNPEYAALIEQRTTTTLGLAL